MVYIQAHVLIMSGNSQHKFLTVQEVSDLLQLSVITIYKYIREEKIEAIEFGGHYRIEASTLRRFIESHKVNKPKQEEIL